MRIPKVGGRISVQFEKGELYLAVVHSIVPDDADPKLCDLVMIYEDGQIEICPWPDAEIVLVDYNSVVNVVDFKKMAQEKETEMRGRCVEESCGKWSSKGSVFCARHDAPARARIPNPKGSKSMSKSSSSSSSSSSSKHLHNPKSNSNSRPLPGEGEPSKFSFSDPIPTKPNCKRDENARPNHFANIHSMKALSLATANGFPLGWGLKINSTKTYYSKAPLPDGSEFTSKKNALKHILISDPTFSGFTVKGLESPRDHFSNIHSMEALSLATANGFPLGWGLKISSRIYYSKAPLPDGSEFRSKMNALKHILISDPTFSGFTVKGLKRKLAAMSATITVNPQPQANNDNSSNYIDDFDGFAPTTNTPPVEKTIPSFKIPPVLEEVIEFHNFSFGCDGCEELYRQQNFLVSERDAILRCEGCMRQQYQK